MYVLYIYTTTSIVIEGLHPYHLYKENKISGLTFKFKLMTLRSFAYMRRAGFHIQEGIS